MADDDNARGPEKTPEQEHEDGEAAQQLGTTPAKLAPRPIVSVDPTRAPMFDERKEVAHSTILEGEREDHSDELKRRAHEFRKAETDKSDD